MDDSPTTPCPAHRAHRFHAPASVLLMATCVFLVSTGGALLRAQAPAPGRTVWDGVYTDAQAARGTQAFGASCTNCHTLAPTGNRPLTGDKFWEGWTQRSVADLLTFVKTNMPNGNGGSLSASTYNDLVAMILKSNGFPAATTELGPETVTGVQIVPRDGPGQLPAGTLARVVGCLVRNGRDWTLTNATAPLRIDKPGVAAEDATAALGDRTLALKFVLTRLDAFAGHRMSASGLLIGAAGADGLNVSEVKSVAATCP
jgi:mono/diheme cytochrome c family protein